MSPGRQTVPSAKYFFRHAPNNVYITELEGSAQDFCGWQAAVAYVIPFDCPATRMDSQTAELFLDLLRAKDRDRAQAALLGLGVIRKEDDPVLPGEVSIARLRTILTGLCACFRLRKRYKGFRYLGTCKIFCTMGTCPHELYARFLDCDSEVTTACLSEWNQLQDPESIVAENAQPSAPLGSLREHIPAVPPASALCTLQFLVERAKARAEKRVEATSTKRKAVAALLESPITKRKNSRSTLADCELPRNKFLRKLAENLASPDFSVRLGVALTCMHENVSSAEAKQYGLDRKLKTFLGQGKCLPLGIAIRRLLASWAASQLALLLHLLIFTLKWLGVYVPSTILVLIGVFSAVKHNKAESR